MQPHEQHDPKPDPPKPKEPDRRDKRAKWLLFVIAVLLGLIVSQVAKRFLPTAVLRSSTKSSGFRRCRATQSNRNLKLAFSGPLKGPLLGRTKIWRRFHAGALTPGHAARSAAGWRSAPLFALGLLLVR